MKILHMADTHLGYSAYRKINKDGVNQRELDIYNSFIEIIDYAIKTKPDIIVHSGDLFDSVRPTNRAIMVALQQILRLSKATIPFVIISGNHETPKLKETGCIFTIFDHLPYVYPVYSNKYEVINLKINNQKICIHAIPHCQTKQIFNTNLKKIKLDKTSKYNVLMLHGAVKAIKEFKMNEFNELIIPIESFTKEFDYIALGHYHNFTKVAQNTYYAGSSERLSFAEAGICKGIIEVELSSKNKFSFKEIKTRPMIDTKPIDCHNLDNEHITKKIIETIKEIQPNEKIFRLKLVNISAHLYRSIDMHEIKKHCIGSIHFEIKFDIFKEGKQIIDGDYQIRSIANEFQKYIHEKNIKEKDIILPLGLKYIQKNEVKDEAK